MGMDKVKEQKNENMSAVELINEAIANVQGNVGKDGLSPQQDRAIVKMQTASRLLTGTQTPLKTQT